MPPRPRELVGADRRARNAHRPALYVARPIQIKQPRLPDLPQRTRGRPPEDDDRAVRPANGFGWKQNEVVGAQIVSVPMTLPIKRSEDTFKVFMISLTAVFAFIFVALNLMLHYIVIWPVTKLSQIADQVSLGQLDAPGFAVKGKDEIAALAGSFERMRTSLMQAMKMLGE